MISSRRADSVGWRCTGVRRAMPLRAGFRPNVGETAGIGRRAVRAHCPLCLQGYLAETLLLAGRKASPVQNYICLKRWLNDRLNSSFSPRPFTCTTCRPRKSRLPAPPRHAHEDRAGICQNSAGSAHRGAP